MGWLFLPESVVSNSDCTEPSPDTELFVTSSGTPTLRRLSWPGWKRRSWVRLLSGTTCPASTASRGVERWIKGLSAEASRAKTCPSPTTREPVSTGSARGSGPSSLGSPCAIYEAATSSLRTSAPSLFEDLTESSVTLPKAGTMRSGTCFERSRSAHRTVVSGSSYSRNEYPTPSATPYGTSQNEGQVAHKRPTAGTPSLDTWAQNWPTPTAGDAKQSGSRNAPGSAAHLGTSLTDQIRTGGSDGRRGRTTVQDGSATSKPAVHRQLSPQFVEALMGLPPGWSSAQIDCDASETESSPRSPNSRGER